MWAVVLVSSLTIVLLLFYAPSPKSEVVPDPALLCNASIGSAQGLALPTTSRPLESPRMDKQDIDRKRRAIGWKMPLHQSRPRTRPHTRPHFRTPTPSSQDLSTLYQTALRSTQSRKAFCALAVVTLAHSESLLRGSPHVAIYSLDHATLSLTIGHLKVMGSPTS